jgi:hypothetical protein
MAAEGKDETGIIEQSMMDAFLLEKFKLPPISTHFLQLFLPAGNFGK